MISVTRVAYLHKIRIYSLSQTMANLPLFKNPNEIEKIFDPQDRGVLLSMKHETQGCARFAEILQNYVAHHFLGECAR